MDDKDNRTEEFSVSGEHVVDKAKELWGEGKARRVVIRRAGEHYVELPLTLAIVGTVLAPHFALVSAVVALATGCSIGVERVAKE